MKKIAEWKIVDIDRMIEALGFLEHPPEENVTWEEASRGQVDGIDVVYLPTPNYGEQVLRYFDLCYDSSCEMDCYTVLPEDPEGSLPDPTLAEMFQTERDFESASLNQVRRFLYLCTRGEKFCDGYIDGQIRNGRLLGAYRRLVTLRSEMKS